MEQIRLLICDEDTAYLHALVLYLVGSDLGFSISSHTDIVSMEDGGEYDIGLMTATFIRKYKELPEGTLRIGNILHLSDGSEAVEGCQDIYKFQSMVTFVEQIMKSVKRRDMGATVPVEDKRMISILSPAHHELLLPYSITVARILGEHDRTLLVDLEQCSVLSSVLGKEPERDLTDLMYLLSSGSLTDIPQEYLGYYEGFYYLPPAAMSLTSAAGMRDIWQTLYSFLMTLDYKNIVVVYDSVLPGMESMISGSGEIFLVNKPGDYYNLYEKEYMRMFADAGLGSRVSEITIPPSAGGVTMDRNILAPVILSALGAYFRKETAGSVA